MTAPAASDLEVTMQTVLSQLNSLPGVAGSLVCDLDGRLVARVFPPVFDASAIEDAVRALVDAATGPDISSETAELLDFRFKEARILVKPFSGSMLVVLCTKAINVQFLILSVGAAVAKLDKLRQAQPAVAAPVTPAASASAAEASHGGDPKLKKRVTAPAKGLDELRRRLAEAAEGPRPDGAETAPAVSPAGPRAATAGAEAQRKQDEAQTTSSPGMRWWEGMS